jgi:hypothetical protein
MKYTCKQKEIYDVENKARYIEKRIIKKKLGRGVGGYIENYIHVYNLMTLDEPPPATILC